MRTLWASVNMHSAFCQGLFKMSMRNEGTVKRQNCCRAQPAFRSCPRRTHKIGISNVAGASQYARASRYSSLSVVIVRLGNGRFAEVTSQPPVRRVNRPEEVPKNRSVFD